MSVVNNDDVQVIEEGRVEVKADEVAGMAGVTNVAADEKEKESGRIGVDESDYGASSSSSLSFVRPTDPPMRREKSNGLGAGLYVMYDGTAENVKDDEGASSSSASAQFSFARPVDMRKEATTGEGHSNQNENGPEVVGGESSCATSSTSPQNDDNYGDEDREDSLMSSRFYDDSDADWARIPFNPSIEAIREVARRPSNAFNVAFMTPAQMFRFYRPEDLYDSDESYTDTGSETLREQHRTYYESLARHEENQRKKREFLKLSRKQRMEEWRRSRRGRCLTKRPYEMVSRRPTEDWQFMRKLWKRRRVGSEELVEDVQDRAERLMRMEVVENEQLAGMEFGQIGQEEAGHIEEMNAGEEQLMEDLGGAAMEVVERPVEMMAVEAVEPEEVVAAIEVADDNLVVMAEATAEDEIDIDEDMPLDRSRGADDDASSVSSTATAIPLRRSQRIRKPIDRWCYPLDHIRRRKRVTRRDATVQQVRPVRRRPMKLLPPPPPVVVKQPRLAPVRTRGQPSLPAPAPATTIAVAAKDCDFAEIAEEVAECRLRARSADYGFEQLDLELAIGRFETTIANLKKRNATPSPCQMKSLLNRLAKIRATLAMQ